MADEADAYIWSMSTRSKSLRLCVTGSKTWELPRAQAENHLVEGGLTREEAERRLDEAHLQVAAIRGGIFSFWTLDRR